jgi:hypothetical protein
LFDVESTTKFDAVGAMQSLEVSDKKSVYYSANASSVTVPSGTITYSPRDGIFTVELKDRAADVSRSVTFQDPAHRADADSARSGEYQVPLLPGFNYLQALDDGAQFTFFYQRPGSSGSFVSLAGFERSKVDEEKGLFNAEQGVFVFGTKTVNLQVPTKGGGRYDGQFLATMVASGISSDPALQWINGTSSVDVDFGTRSIALSLNGIVGPAYIKDTLVDSSALSIRAGATFTANGSATWAQGSSAFAGKFSSAKFTLGSIVIPVDFTSVSAGTGVAGASSIDGTFYGPDAKNIGGNFRITGGVPNTRIDVLGAFAGSKK